MKNAIAITGGINDRYNSSIYFRICLCIKVVAIATYGKVVHD